MLLGNATGLKHPLEIGLANHAAVHSHKRFSRGFGVGGKNPSLVATTKPGGPEAENRHHSQRSTNRTH